VDLPRSPRVDVCSGSCVCLIFSDLGGAACCGAKPLRRSGTRCRRRGCWRGGRANAASTACADCATECDGLADHKLGPDDGWQLIPRLSKKVHPHPQRCASHALATSKRTEVLRQLSSQLAWA
jgi:hypothetical protein